jgi:hypothetical protein
MTNLDIRNVSVLVHGDLEPMSADVVVGYDYTDLHYEFDARIFYYFEDEAEFVRAKTEGLVWFRVVSESE